MLTDRQEKNCELQNQRQIDHCFVGQTRPEEGYSQPLSGDIEDFDLDEEDNRSQ